MPSADPTSAAPGRPFAGTTPVSSTRSPRARSRIGALALAMAIPLLFVRDVVRERTDRYAEALADIARTRGARQTLAGPVPAVLSTETRTVEGGRRGHLAHGAAHRPLPTRSPTRSRPCAATRRGWPSGSATPARSTRSRTWRETGVRSARPPGSRVDELGAGFHAPFPGLGADAPFALAMTMAARGSDEFRFAPPGETTAVAVRSGWPHPSFRGHTRVIPRGSDGRRIGPGQAVRRQRGPGGSRERQTRTPK